MEILSALRGLGRRDSLGSQGGGLGDRLTLRRKGRKGSLGGQESPLPPRPPTVGGRGGLNIQEGPKRSSSRIADGPMVCRMVENESIGGLCPGCHMPYDQGQKRRLVDSCGHERCYSCLFRQEECTVCRAQGKAAAREQDNLYKSMDPDCLYGSTPGGWRGMTPPSGRRTPAPSPRAGGRRTWVQRHSRRPNTVSIDDNTMSDDGTTSTVSSLAHPASCQMPRRRPPSSDRRVGNSCGRESGFQSTSSLTSLVPSLYDNPITTLSGSRDTLGRGAALGSSDSLASLASGPPSLIPPAMGGRRHSLSRLVSKLPFPRLGGRQTPELHSMAPPTPQFRPVQWFLKPLFFEVPQREAEPVFVGRDWLFRETMDHLTSDLPTNRGVIISGTPGTGKTALILKLVQHSCFGQGASGMRGEVEVAGRAASHMRRLAPEVVAFHFCQIDNSVTCLVGEWVHSLAAQLAQAPALTAYHQLLSTDHSLRTLLALPQCTTDPHAALTRGILQPLNILRQAGKVPANNCIILIDGLCDAQFHRPDFGDTLITFIARHLATFPAWLKIVATVRSCMKEEVKCLPFHSISLDNFDVDERVTKDISDYISLRLAKSRSIVSNTTPTAKRVMEESPQARFQKYLESTAKGCFLFVKLTLDLIERGHLVLKSSSFKVLPQSLSEVFLLELNLKFPTAQSFRGVAEILAICLSSLRPLSLEEIFHSVGALSLAPTVSWTEFLSSYRQISEYLVRRKDETVMFFHPLFREWLMRRPESEGRKFLVDPRIGHAAHAMRLSRMSPPVDPDSSLELCHHILKAHLYRNSSCIVAPRDLQSSWISLCSDDVSSALVCHRNLSSPNVNVSRLLLLSGASPDSTTSDGVPLLCVFAQQGFGEMVALLLEFGGDIDRGSSQGWSPIIYSAMEGCLDTTRLLVEKGAQINQQDRSQRCALVHAARQGHLRIVEYLVSCDWSQASSKDLDLGEATQQALVAAASGGHRVVLDFLLDMAEVVVDCADTLMGETALCAAAAANQRDCCEGLLAREATVSAANLQGVTPLQAAAKEGHWTLCELLLKVGANLEHQDTLGRTALMVASMEGHLGVVELLLSRKADLEKGDKVQLTALSLAAAHGKLETAKFLVTHGADANTADKTGRTPLDLAAFNGDPELVQLLLDQGAMMEHVDIHGMRPLDRAIGEGHAGAVSVFLKKGAKLGPTTWTSASGKPQIMLILLNKLLEDGNTLYKKGRLEEAAVRYTYAAKRVPLGLDGAHQQVFHQLRVHLLLNLSRCRRKQQDHGEAARLASEALSLAPTCPEAFHARAKASHAAGRLEAALRDLTEAVRVAPQNRELHKILLTLKLEMKEKAKEQAEVKDSRDSSSGVCSSGEGSTKDFDQDNETSL